MEPKIFWFANGKTGYGEKYQAEPDLNHPEFCQDRLRGSDDYGKPILAAPPVLTLSGLD